MTQPGFNVNHTDSLGHNALFFCAVYKCPLHVWRMLLDLGADVNQVVNKRTCLSEYLGNNEEIDHSIVKLLLSNGFELKLLTKAEKSIIQHDID